MFDFTKEIPLESKSYSLYRKLQLALYFSAILSAVYFAYLILFPHKIFSFSFLKPNAIENNITTPEINGNMPNMTFSNVVPDYYSHATIALDIPKKADKIPITASVRKSYRAFFYPEAEPIGFKDGALLASSGKYYIVSNGDFRNFESFNAAFLMGYSAENFLEVPQEELEYNPPGQTLRASDSYPDSAIFSIDGNYYIIRGGKLTQFSSLNAFRSQYDEKIALKKSAEILRQIPVSEELIGFADGSLVSNGDSAYIVSAGSIYPIDNAETFLDKGYLWKNILPATSSEVSLYERTRLFNVKDAHPDGTIFKTAENRKFYLIKEGKKHSLPSANIAASWRNAPVLASQKSLETREFCALKKGLLRRGTYSCTIMLENFAVFSGNEYEITFNSEAGYPVDYASVDYKKNTDVKNLKLSLLGIFNKIKLNYGIQIPNE